MEKTLNALFVYGILKNQYVHQEARVYGYRLLDLGHFPAAIPHHEGIVKGQLIWVSDETVADFDMIEGHPNFYIRTDVEVETGDGDSVELVRAEMYVVNETYHAHESQPTGALTIELAEFDKVEYEYTRRR